jgi:hypothetical protein
MLSGMQWMSGQCSRTAAANSEKLEGRPKPLRSACHTAGVPSAIKMFSVGPRLIALASDQLTAAIDLTQRPLLTVNQN